MVLDNLDNYHKYILLHPSFQKVFQFVLNTDWSAMEYGRYELEGDKCFVNFFTQKGNTECEALYETHQKYIDIQIPLGAKEKMCWAPKDSMKQVISPYSDSKDVEFYSDAHDYLFAVAPRQFVIFWPEDAHKPSIGDGSWDKLVAKVKVG